MEGNKPTKPLSAYELFFRDELSEMRERESEKQAETVEQQLKTSTSGTLERTDGNGKRVESDASSERQMGLTAAEGFSMPKCVRKTCTKPSAVNPDWQYKYCSNDCMVRHYNEEFNYWLQSGLEY